MKNTTQATRFPLDYDALEKGCYIPPDEIQAQCEHPRDTKKYQLYVLTLIETIRKHLYANGKSYTVKQDRDGIRILTDEEATEYNASRWDMLKGQLGRTHMQMLGVQTPLLADDAARNAHLRRCQLQAFELSGMHDGLKRGLDGIKATELAVKATELAVKATESTAP